MSIKRIGVRKVFNRYFKYIFYIKYLYPAIILTVISCGTEPELFTLSQGWSEAGLSNYSINSLHQKGQFIYAATNHGLYRTQVSEKNIQWHSLGLQKQNIYDLIVFSNGKIMAASAAPDFSSKQTTLYLTTNSGASWTDYQNGFGGPDRYTWVEKIERDPVNPEILYASRGGLIARSPDEGKSWELPSNESWDGWGGTSYVINPTPLSPGTVWTGGISGLLEPVLYKSTNYGKTWSFLQNVSENNQGQIIETAIYDLAIHPTSSDTLIIGMGGGMRRTIDSGNNWSDVYFNNSIYALARDPDDPNHVYASGINQDSTLYFIASADFGINWSGQERSPFEEDLYTNVMLSGTFDGLKVIFFGTNNGLYSYVFTN